MPDIDIEELRADFERWWLESRSMRSADVYRDRPVAYAKDRSWAVWLLNAQRVVDDAALKREGRYKWPRRSSEQRLRWARRPGEEKHR